MHELSGYLLIRTGGLMVLTLVATTLPADAVIPPAPQDAPETSPSSQNPPSSEDSDTPAPAPASPDDQPDRPPASPSPSSREADSPGAGTPDWGRESFRAVIWNGREWRPTFSGNFPSFLAHLMTQPRPAFQDPFDAPRLIRIESGEPGPSGQRRWMACRQANAPPVG